MGKNETGEKDKGGFSSTREVFDPVVEKSDPQENILTWEIKVLTHEGTTTRKHYLPDPLDLADSL